MKILLLGVNGQIGFELARALAPMGELVLATRSGVLPGGEKCLKADLADADALADALQSASADIVVNAAAYTAVDQAEDEPERADRINHGAVAQIGRWAARCKALVVHYSTDYVFDGQSTRAYREDTPPAPLGVYGRSKLAGEIALRESYCSHLILRTAWVYGARGNNFLRTMLRLGRERDRISVVADQRGAPTSSRLIAATTAMVLTRWSAFDPAQRAAASGTYHLSAQGECTWYDFAQTIFLLACTASLLQRRPQVDPIATAQYPTKARRPAYSVLDTAKLQAMFGLHLPPWLNGLVATIGELAETKIP